MLVNSKALGEVSIESTTSFRSSSIHCSSSRQQSPSVPKNTTRLVYDKMVFLFLFLNNNLEFVQFPAITRHGLTDPKFRFDE